MLDIHLLKLEGQVRGTQEIINVYSDMLTELGEKVYNESDLRESWLERNVTAEGEVTILRERVDEQDRKIEELEKTLAQALRLLAEFNTLALAGKFFIFSKFWLLTRPVASPSLVALPIVINVDALPSSPPPKKMSAPKVMPVPVNKAVFQTMPVGDTSEEGEAVLDVVPAVNEALANAMPVALFALSEQVPADDGAPALASSVPSSLDMPPPDVPSPLDMPPPDVPSSQVPQVNLLPPTLNTSQEAANSGPTTLLTVPDPTTMSDPLPSNTPSRSRSQSCSPAPDSSKVRWSPRLASPTPSTKHPASDVLEEPAAKKPKQ